jgi:cell division protein FtsN
MGHFFTQRGNTLVGFILGLVVGLTVALGVAVYVTKVPIPFLNKGLTRNADQDAAEEKKNKDWDPNAPLYGKTPAANAPSEPAKPAKPAADVVPPTSAPAPAPAASQDPLGDLAAGKAQQADAFYYFVQVGAFRSSEEAESQRAKLSLGGFDPAISQREQEGKIIYRVRVGPYDSKSQAEQIQTQLKSNKFESALIRVQR